MAGAEPKPPSADEITTNLKLQKIKDTDYAGNFPTIYNNNLDLIDVLNNKQSKWKIHSNNNFNDIITTNVIHSGNINKFEVNVLKDLRFTFYSTADAYGPKPIKIDKFEIRKGKYVYIGNDSDNQFYPIVDRGIIVFDIDSYLTFIGLTTVTLCYIERNENNLFSPSYNNLGLYSEVKYPGGSSYVGFELSKQTSSNHGRLLNYLNEISFDSIKSAVYNVGIETKSGTDRGFCCYIIEYLD